MSTEHDLRVKSTMGNLRDAEDAIFERNFKLAKQHAEYAVTTLSALIAQVDIDHAHFEAEQSEKKARVKAEQAEALKAINWDITPPSIYSDNYDAG